jgi:holo-[acyl-carrier protein] synthase
VPLSLVSVAGGAEDRTGGPVIVGMGVDLAEVERIQRSVDRYGERFLTRIYTAAERSYSMRKQNYAERLAVRFAAKEAGMKAIGTGWRHGVTWKDFEVLNEPGGKPLLRISGIATEFARKLGVKRVSLSMTHTAGMALAMVVLEDGQ